MSTNKNLIPKWDCYTVKCKQRKNKKSNSYKIISWEVLPSVSTYYGLSIATTKGGEFTGVLPYNQKYNGEYCSPFNKNTIAIVGISEMRYSEFTLVLLQKTLNEKIVTKSNGFGEIGIYPVPHRLFSVNIDRRFCNFIDRLIKSQSEGTLYSDYQFPTSYMWDILPNVPKGYHLVRTGTVRKDDLYWDKTHWIKCDVSFSPLNCGKTIEKQIFGFHSKKGSYTCIHYNEDIIRKNTKK